MAESYTRFERARIIGARALQISTGAPFLAKLSKKQIEEFKYNPIEIAKYEFFEGLIPIQVKRRLPMVNLPVEEPKAAPQPVD